MAAGDPDALADRTRLAADLDVAISQAVAGLRKTGYSWAEIAARLGVTRQAAQGALGPLVAECPTGHESWGCQAPGPRVQWTRRH